MMAYHKSRTGKTLEQNRKASAKYRKKNKEQTLKRIARWRKNNPHKVAEYTDRRCTYLKEAKPSWANDDAIKEIYLERDRLNALGEDVYHVDHIIPLLGENVCGLHCEDNLQVLTAEGNLKKRNLIT